MKVMMIYAKPDFDKKPRFGFSYEMLTIATILSKKFELFLKDYSCQQYEVDELSSELIKNSINIVLVECDSFALKRSENINNAKKIISVIKKINIGIQVIAYGNQCYTSKKNIDGADITVKNNDINELISAVYSYFGTKTYFENIAYDALPIINRRMLLNIEYYNANNNSTLIQTSKGCENTCVFCQRKGWQKKYEIHSDEYVLNEFTQLKIEGYENIWVIDENFTFNLLRAKRILKMLKESKLIENMKIFISSWANIDFEFLDLAVECNVNVISFGIESGNKGILQFYKKNIDLDKAKEMILYANSIGIFTVGNFIIGAPMETESTIQQTFEYINKCKFDQVNIKTLDYMIGSELYEGINESLKVSNHVFACSENGLNKFSLKELIYIKDNFVSKYYKTHREVLLEKISKYGTPYN